MDTWIPILSNVMAEKMCYTPGASLALNQSVYDKVGMPREVPARGIPRAGLPTRAPRHVPSRTTDTVLYCVLLPQT